MLPWSGRAVCSERSAGLGEARCGSQLNALSETTKPAEWRALLLWLAGPQISGPICRVPASPAFDFRKVNLTPFPVNLTPLPQLS